MHVGEKQGSRTQECSYLTEHVLKNGTVVRPRVLQVAVGWKPEER